MVDDNLQKLMKMHQFTLFDGLENLIRVLVGFEITVDVSLSDQTIVFAMDLILLFVKLNLTLDSTSWAFCTGLDFVQ